jgi:putative MATE family efflux protein
LSETDAQRHDPLTGPVVPVFFHYAIPSVLGMLAATSAGVIDGVFIGNFVGSEALAAVNIALPMWAVFSGIVFMLAVGGSVVCGKYFGEKDPEGASDVFTKTMIVTTALGVLITVASLAFLDELVWALGASEAIHGPVTVYMRIILWFAPLLIVGLTLYYFVRVDGRPVLAAIGLIGFSVVNVALNALFIVGLGWGIEGAAWASALANAFIFVILITHLFHPKCSLRFAMKDRDWRVVLRAAWNGFSEFTNELSIGLLVWLFNWVMITRLGVAGVAAYTIIGYLVMLGLEVCYGISESLQPTVSKNLGARQPERIVRFLLTGLLFAFAVGLSASALFVLVPEWMVSLFLGDNEAETMAIALEFIAWFWPAFLFNGMNLTLASYFTALHRPVPSAAIALSRSLVLPGLGLLLLPRWLGDIGIFVAVPLAEALTFVFALALVLRLRPRFGTGPGTLSPAVELRQSA